MKSPYYVATVTNAYRRAIDDCIAGQPFDESLVEELEKTSHRRYTTGFYFGEKDKEFLQDSMPIQTHEFMAIVKEDAAGGFVVVEQRNRFKRGDVLEVLSPNSTHNQALVVGGMTNTDGDIVEDASRVQELLKVETSLDLRQGDILRKKID